MVIKVCARESLNHVHGSVQTFRMEVLLVEHFKDPVYVGTSS